MLLCAHQAIGCSFLVQAVHPAMQSMQGRTLLGLAVCSTMVAVGWSQDPASCSLIIILLTMACTCKQQHDLVSDRAHGLTRLGSNLCTDRHQQVRGCCSSAELLA